MLQIVFSAQEKNIIKLAFHHSLKIILNENTTQNCLIDLSLAHDIGDISGSIIGQKRKKIITQFFFDSIQNHFESSDTLASFWKQQVENFKILKEKAKQKIPIRIWYSNSPYSLCGFYSTVYELREFDCQISAVKLPECVCNCREGFVTSWGEIDKAKIFSYLAYETKLLNSERLAIAEYWLKLKKENDAMRVSINGHLFSVYESFYDNFICKLLANHICTVSQLIFDVIHTYGFGIGDWLIAKRIEYLLDIGEFCMLRHVPNFYDCTIKRNLVD